MLLFESILQQRSPNLKLLLGNNGYSNMRSTVNKAQKFVLDKSLSDTADRMPLEQIEGVLPRCRVPFETVWLECLQNDRPHFRAAPTQEGTQVPQRVGVLISAGLGSDDPDAKVKGWQNSRQKFLAHLFWNFPHYDDVQLCIYAMLVNLTEEPDPYIIGFRKLAHSPINNATENRVTPFPSPFCFTLFGAMMEQGKGNKSPEIREFIDSQLDNWRAEMGFWWAVLALLNCKNVVNTHTVDVRGINKSRAKQGKPLFSEHKILHLRLPKIQREHIDHGGTHASPRGHFVMGHFKTRKTGMYWWNDFFRGDPNRVVSKTYKAEMRPDDESD